jgi:23S rRNA (adenine2503-C2)-methyltransferase
MQIPGIIDPVVIPRAALPATDKRDLLGLDRAELRAALVEAGIPEAQTKMRSGQIWHWIYHRGLTDFAAMSNIAKDTREMLAAHFVVGRPGIVTEQISEDGTRKWLLRTLDGNEYEMVFIPDADRGTLCVSAQIGCTLNCRFCHTGTMKLVRNLSVDEIVGQIMLARDSLGEWPSSAEGRLLSNIVLMGMGEPLYNFEQSKKPCTL